MRRPEFKTWIRKEVLKRANTRSFNLRRIALAAQGEKHETVAPALMLFAYENDQVERLYSLIQDTSLLDEYRLVEMHLGGRSAGKLALRGTPVLSLPKAYRDVLAAFESDYYRPERVKRQKAELAAWAYELMVSHGLSPAEIAHTLSLDPGNVHAFIVRGDPGRFTLETAWEIVYYLEAL